jgi:hypothetical protein
MFVAIAANGNAANRKFRNTRCGIAFEYPRGWNVHRGPASQECGFRVSPRDVEERTRRDDMDLYTIWVDVRSVGFTAGLEESGFERHDGQWVVLGRQGMTSPAERIERNGWSGLRGMSETGCYFAGGGYAGMCSVPAVFAGNDKRSFEITGAPQSEAAFDTVVKTIRFVTPK